MAQFERGVYEPSDDVRVFDGSEEEEDVEGSRLPLLIVLALLVLAMFAGVVWLAYTQGVARGRSETPVLTAEAGPGARRARKSRRRGGALSRLQDLRAARAARRGHGTATSRRARRPSAKRRRPSTPAPQPRQAGCRRNARTRGKDASASGETRRTAHESRLRPRPRLNPAPAAKAPAPAAPAPKAAPLPRRRSLPHRWRRLLRRPSSLPPTRRLLPRR